METCSKLELWQRRLSQSNTYYQTEVEKMDRREAQYRGDREISPLVDGDKSPSGAKHQATHVRNIIFENIESQVSVAIPQPKVTPRRKKDEGLASLIEHLIRNELDRLPMERINDMSERTVPIQGGVGYLTDWDNSKRTHTTVGEVDIAMVHPKQFAPQPGVYTSVADMDWFIVKLPTTKAAVRRRYGKSVYQESESEPEIRGAGDADHNEDAVTQYVGFAINDQGGIDRYSWVNNVELEDLENYQARRQQVCAKCGMQRPAAGQILAGHIAQEIRPPEPDPNGQLAAEMLAMRLAEEQMGMEPTGISAAVPGEPEQRYDGGACPWCGCEKFESRTQKFEQIFVPMQTAGGLQIPGAAPGLDAQGMPAMIPAQIPYYVPDVYPIVIQRSVSVYGQLLGNSDVDVIADQQNTANRLSKKIIDRLLKAGTRITLPPKANLQTDPSDGEIWYLENVPTRSTSMCISFPVSCSMSLPIWRRCMRRPGRSWASRILSRADGIPPLPAVLQNRRLQPRRQAVWKVSGS